MFVFKELDWGDRWYGLPRPGLDNPTPFRNEGDLPKPFMLFEDFEGELRVVGVGEGLALGPFAGASFFLRPDMAAFHVSRTADNRSMNNEHKKRLPIQALGLATIDFS